jgi:hypothetical protein
MQQCAALMIEKTVLESVWWGWVILACPLLRSNIPRTALVATLDTYDLVVYKNCFPTESILSTGFQIWLPNEKKRPLFCHHMQILSTGLQIWLPNMTWGGTQKKIF